MYILELFIYSRYIVLHVVSIASFSICAFSLSQHSFARLFHATYCVCVIDRNNIMAVVP